MGPKKKGGKKKGGKAKGSGKRKKDQGETMTFKEAVMIYQLELKQKQINESRDDIDDLEFRNEKQKQRNAKLKRQQNLHVKDVIGQARAFEKKIKEEKQIPYENVEEALNIKRETAYNHENEVQALQSSAIQLSKGIDEHKRMLKQLETFQRQGQFTNNSLINMFMKEMNDMDTSYKEMSDFFEKSLFGIKSSITKRNEEDVTNHKRLATEHAMRHMDDKVEDEFSDNKWLHKEVQIHQQSLSEITLLVDRLEKENMAIITELFNMQIGESSDKRVSISRNNSNNQEELMIENGSISPMHDGTDEKSVENWEWLDNYLPEFNVWDSSENSGKADAIDKKFLYVVGRAATPESDDESLLDEKGFRKFALEKKESSGP